MSMDRIWRVLLSSVILAAVPALAASHIFYVSAIASTFYPYVFASVIFIHLRLRFRWIDVAGIVLLGVLFALFDALVLHPGPVYIVTWVSFLGMGSLAIMGLRAVWLEGEDRRVILLALVPGILILASNHFAGYLHKWTEGAHPNTLDLYLYSFDASMHVPIAFLAGQAFEKWKIFGDVSFVFYVGLPFTLAVVYAGQAVRLRGRAIPIFIAFLIAGPIGGIFYNLFPALGPIHLFGERFPWQPLTTDQARRLLLEPVPLSGLRNAIPSLHMGWTLMAWWYSRGLSIWERGLAFLFVALTVVSTMGTGEHYFIDLVVAFPFVLFLQALCTVSLHWDDSRRLVPFAFGLMVPLVWLWALRFEPRVFWYSPVIPWTCCVVTIAITELARRGLKDAAVEITAAAEVAPSTAPAAVAELVR
ncbi:MAG: phosphatase PAP2 family protein [Candidatus Acidiferrum sp.]|jgi:PAP2 superfamily protein